MTLDPWTCPGRDHRAGLRLGRGAHAAPRARRRVPRDQLGDVFFSVAPDGKVPAGQPFATLTTKDYPGEPDAGLDRPGSFRVNIAEGRRDRTGVPGADDGAGRGTPDRVKPHPTYADLGWVAVVDPGERTRAQVLALLQTAHSAALARWQRRHDGTAE